MATTQKTTIASTTNDNLVVLPPKVQRLLTALREGRNLASQAKEMSDTSRDAILAFLGSVTADLIGVDAKGKRLLSVKLVKSSRKFDLDALEKEQPEMYASLVKMGYIVETGQGEPTPRLNLL
jgi:hypothetical protein